MKFNWYLKNAVLVISILFSPKLLFSTTYYIDYESGNNQSDGLSAQTSWKHCPGDLNATNNPLQTELQPSDIILFKGGVRYRGAIEILSSGEENNRITFIGDNWPGLESVKAIIDGSEPLTGWVSEGDGIYSAYIPELLLDGRSPATFNLHEYNSTNNEDEFLWISQDPNPPDPFFNSDRSSFYTVTNENLTLTSLTDSEVFNQSDPDYWNNCWLLIWTNPNLVIPTEITSFDPGSHTVYFEPLHDEAIYPDGRDQSFAVYNSIPAMDLPGEYVVDLTDGKIYLYPRNPSEINGSISYSRYAYGFDLNAQSHIQIEGFKICKQAGEGLRDAVGIGCRSAAHIDIEDIQIFRNEIYHQRHLNSGYGGIFVSNASDSRISNNSVTFCPDTRGIFVTGSERISVDSNYVERSGVTSITMYSTKNSRMVYNTVIESKGDHANGITIYIASKNILVACNKVLDSNSPITFQDCGNLYFINNFVDANNGGSNVNEWGRTSRGPWEWGDIVFLNNTFVRNNRNASVNIGSGADDLIVNDTLTIPGNNYVFINNILDGGAVDSIILRENNLYTGLAWSQSDRYGWSLMANEFMYEEMDSIFSDTVNADFSLKQGSPAIDAGRIVTGYYPVDVFPDFNFLTDIEGRIRPYGINIDIGAWEFGAKMPGEDTDFEFNLYPNPTKGDLTLEMSEFTENLFYTIYTIDGRKIDTKELFQQITPIDISFYSEGIYIFFVHSKNKKPIKFFKLIKT